jgi:hypothetical protein
VDDDVERLKAVQAEREQRGFRTEGIGSGPCSPCDSKQLTVLKVGRYSAASFATLEQGLCEVATRHDLELYWGALPTDRRHWPARTRPAVPQ